MKKVLIGLLCLTSTIFAQESECCDYPSDVCSASPYAELGLGPFPIPLPVFGLGYRSQYNHRGFDISGSVSTIIAWTNIKGSLLYLYYPRPCLESQFYFGAGGAVSYFAGEDNGVYLSPEFVFGKEYITNTGGKRFFQAKVNWPAMNPKDIPSDTIWFPWLVISYGVKF